MTVQTQYRYTLEKGSKKHTCPVCDYPNKFVLYVDTFTGEYLADYVGKCERADGCGHHYPPRDYFKDKGIKPEDNSVLSPAKPLPPPVFLPSELLKDSRIGYERNGFVNFLIQLFGEEITSNLVGCYHIGTSNHWGGSTVFWFINQHGQIRAGQVKQFDSKGHTIKDTTTEGQESRTNWVHTILEHTTPLPWPQWLRDYYHSENKVGCLFGEHLLINEKTKPIALFEAPKTAIIAASYFPDFVCLAVGALDWLSEARLNALKGRNVVLFPDLSPKGTAFEKWVNKSLEFSTFANFRVSDLLEKNATDQDRAKGLDLADYLVRFDFREFEQGQNIRKPNINEANEPIRADVEPLKPLIDILHLEPATFSNTPVRKPQKHYKTLDWSMQIEALEAFFDTATLPLEPVRLDSCTKITDVALFVEAHLATVKRNDGNPRFLHYLNRLQALKMLISEVAKP